MNRTLIRMLDSINQLLAIAIVIGSIKVTYDWAANPYAVGYNSTQLMFALFAGTIGGVMIASVICGLLAVLIEIERHLRRIASTTAAPVAPAAIAPPATTVTG